jgi:hypothetical protein
LLPACLRHLLPLRSYASAPVTALQSQERSAHVSPHVLWLLPQRSILPRLLLPLQAAVERERAALREAALSRELAAMERRSAVALEADIGVTRSESESSAHSDLRSSVYSRGPRSAASSDVHTRSALSTASSPSHSFSASGSALLSALDYSADSRRSSAISDQAGSIFDRSMDSSVLTGCVAVDCRCFCTAPYCAVHLLCARAPPPPTLPVTTISPMRHVSTSPPCTRHCYCSAASPANEHHALPPSLQTNICSRLKWVYQTATPTSVWGS